MSDQWHHIVEQYSALGLTKETDRLPALSGLAQRTSSVLGQYVAGLWSNTLVSDLMWRVNKLDINLARPTNYIGPSWSWVSINGPVTYWADLDLAIDEHLKEVNRAEAELKRGTVFSTEFNSHILRMNYKKQAVRRAGSVNFKSSEFVFHPVGHLIKSAGKNPFGSISSGTLVLEPTYPGRESKIRLYPAGLRFTPSTHIWSPRSS